DGCIWVESGEFNGIVKILRVVVIGRDRKLFPIAVGIVVPEYEHTSGLTEIGRIIARRIVWAKKTRVVLRIVKSKRGGRLAVQKNDRSGRIHVYRGQIASERTKRATHCAKTSRA